MNSITRTPSTSSENDSPRKIGRKSLLCRLEIPTADDPLVELHSLATEVFLGALQEPSPFNPPSTLDKALADSKQKETQTPKTSLESYFGRQGSTDSPSAPHVWNTGYFNELTTGSGDLWKDRSVWASHPSVFETRKKKEAEKYAMENKEGGHGCGVLFRGW